jgi:drug/metabolite transporter (DMT)-like permease
MRSRLGPQLTVASCAAFWGSLGLVIREIDLSAVTLVTFRVGIAAIALGGWLLLKPDEVGRRFVVHHPVRTVAQGVILAVHWVLFFAALQRAPVGLVTLLVYLSPVMVAVASPVVLGEAVSRRVMAAIGLALVGSALLLGPGTDGVEPAGVIEAVLAAVLLAALILNAKVLSPVYGGLRLSLAQVTVASIVLLPVAVLGDGSWPVREDVGWVLLLGVVYTAVALGIYLGALGHIPAVHTSVLSYLEPLSAAVLGWLVLDEALGLGTVVGGLLVIVGGLLVLGEPGTEEMVVSPEAAGTTGSVGR